MRTQEEIKDRLIEFYTRPELDPLQFKRELLVRFATKETLSEVAPINAYGTTWAPLSCRREEVVKRFYRFLCGAYADLLMGKSTISCERRMQKIEIFLWLLKDIDAYHIYNDDAPRIKIIQSLMGRYE